MEIAVIAGYFNDHVESNSEEYEDVHEGYGYRVTNREREETPEFFAAMNITVVNTFLQNRASHLITDESGPLKIQVYFCLVNCNQGKFLKGIEV